jgi:hypothetical protein
MRALLPLTAALATLWPTSLWAQTQTIYRGVPTQSISTSQQIVSAPVNGNSTITQTNIIVAPVNGVQTSGSGRARIPYAYPSAKVVSTRTRSSTTPTQNPVVVIVVNNNGKDVSNGVVVNQSCPGSCQGSIRLPNR